MSAFSDLITGSISKEEFDDLVKKEPKKEENEDFSDLLVFNDQPKRQLKDPEETIQKKEEKKDEQR